MSDVTVGRLPVVGQSQAAAPDQTRIVDELLRVARRQIELRTLTDNFDAARINLALAKANFNSMYNDILRDVHLYTKAGLSLDEIRGIFSGKESALIEEGNAIKKKCAEEEAKP